MWEQPYGCVSRVVVDEYYVVSSVSQGRCREATAQIRMYKINRRRRALDWQSNDPLLVLCLDADCAH